MSVSSSSVSPMTLHISPSPPTSVDTIPYTRSSSRASMTHPRHHMASHPLLESSPAKKQSKWSPEEDELIIPLRGQGMKWEDIAKQLPGRSAISCRLHYQNYLERKCEWDEERKNKLARLYERFKADMWARIAEDMHIPWRAVEAMHWQLGEQDMARRAGVVPFSLTAVSTEQEHAQFRTSPIHPPPYPGPQLPTYAQSTTMPPTRYGRQGPSLHSLDGPRPVMHPHPQQMPARAGDVSRPPAPPVSSLPTQHAQQPYDCISPRDNLRDGPPHHARHQMLPSIKELTTGLPPYGGPPPPPHHHHAMPPLHAMARGHAGPMPMPVAGSAATMSTSMTPAPTPTSTPMTLPPYPSPRGFRPRSDLKRRASSDIGGRGGRSGIRLC